jgi:alpha-galactosidase
VPDRLDLAFPSAPAGDAPVTTIMLSQAGEDLPAVTWVGALAPGEAVSADEVGAVCGPLRGVPLLAEHSVTRFLTPGLRGHRLGGDGATVSGLSWSTSLRTANIEVEDRRLLVEAADADAELGLVTEVEALPGGALRARHRLTNTGTTPYMLEALDVSLPVPDSHTEVLDFTGRHERERIPQRHELTDGVWSRESRRGKPGAEAPTLLVAGVPGFSTTHGEAVGAHVGWSGNSVLRLERGFENPTTLSGGELLLPGEVTLEADASYTTPWVYVMASGTGLDGLAASLHMWERSLPSHPTTQLVTLNVWEAVYFDHDLDRLLRLADLAARVGVERFVLDDGWFHARRHDRAGLGDWWVDPEVWPDGLTPLAKRVHELGMEFGLWFEPEMVNPDSDLYRAHPDWVLSAGPRIPALQRHQLVVDLTHPEAKAHLLSSIGRVLDDSAVDFVKWDHNRDLLEGGSTSRGGVPAVHAQTAAYLELLDELRSQHPGVTWESCAAGGGRIDLETIRHVQRFWTSDMTDALARQQIQRWTGQIVAPEYLGAHVSAPTSHQTGRTLSLDFRAGTAFFCSFGIEWDLTTASAEDLDRLAEWVDLHKTHRELLHSGRVVRPESTDPAVLLHGVVATDRATAIMAHVQMEESSHNRGVMVRVPGLLPDASYSMEWLGPVDSSAVSHSVAPGQVGPAGERAVSGRVLADVGLWIPRRRPETVTLLRLSTT